MAKFTMKFIRTEDGIRRDFDGWDDGLVNFGYIECEDIAPVPLTSTELGPAKEEAERFWKQLAPPGIVEYAPEGYWIVSSRMYDGREIGLGIDHMEIKIFLEAPTSVN